MKEEQLYLMIGILFNIEYALSGEVNTHELKCFMSKEQMLWFRYNAIINNLHKCNN